MLVSLSNAPLSKYYNSSLGQTKFVAWALLAWVKIWPKLINSSPCNSSEKVVSNSWQSDLTFCRPPGSLFFVLIAQATKNQLGLALAILLHILILSICRHWWISWCTKGSEIFVRKMENFLCYAAHQRAQSGADRAESLGRFWDLPLQSPGRVAEAELRLPEAWEAQLEEVSRGCVEHGQGSVWEDCQRSCMHR